MIRLIFYGRLTSEKWFDIILRWIDKYKWSQIINNIKIDIYWDWELAEETQKMILINAFENIVYHGWQPFSIIKNAISDADYALMPSRFLETFWLSALESCELWKPIIWWSKWWLEQFVLSELDLWSYDSDTEFGQFEKCMDYVINSIDDELYNKLSQKSKEIAIWFDKKTRLENRDIIVNKK